MKIRYFLLIILFFLNFKVFAMGKYNFPISEIYVKPIEISYEKHCPIDYREEVYFYLKNYNNSKKYKNILNLLNKEYNLSYSDSLKYIANAYKNNKIQKPKSKKEIIYQINEEANRFFEKNLYMSHGEEGLKYLKDRGITNKNIKDYRIGWAIDNNYALLNHLKFLGYDENMIHKSGFALKFYKDVFDTFRNRVTFPIFDKNGRIIGHSGRWLVTKKPKYINTPKTKIHDVKKIFFNSYQSQEEIKKTNSIIVFEGNFDSLTAHFHGIKNTVSLMGIEMSNYQIAKVFNSVDNIYLCLDSDSPGINATREITDKILPHITEGKVLKFIGLPKNTEVDELILKQGNKKFEEIKNNSLSLNEYIWKFEINVATNYGRHKLTKKEKFKLSIKLHRIATKIGDSKTRFDFIKYYRKKLSEL